MTRIYSLLAAGALSLGWLALAVAPAHARAPNGTDYQRWSRALDTLAEQGFERIEEIELSLTGRFDVDALDAQRVEHDLRLSRDGSKIDSRQSDGSIDDIEDTLTLDQVRAALAWLQAQGYRDLKEISGDDGLIEIKARSTDNRRAELKLRPGTHELVELEFERLIDFD